MALLTPIQAQGIVNSITPKCVCVNGTYLQWELVGQLDNLNYYCNTKSHGDIHADGSVKDGLLGLDENSDIDTEVKPAMQAYFETQTYLGIKPVIG